MAFESAPPGGAAQRETAMAPDGSGELRTVRLLGSQTLARPEQPVALMLYTDLFGPIAFALNEQIVGTLRRDLAIAEQYLRQPVAKA
jgi:hypothetical protein